TNWNRSFLCFDYFNLGAEESKCDLCGRSFTTKFALHRHIRKVHEGISEGVLPCTCCGKKFSAKHGLERHMRLIHESAELSICPLCNRTFTTKFAFNRHTRTVHASEFDHFVHAPSSVTSALC
ncbi:Zinc finger protein 40, partial [Fasciola hepatica]